MKALPSDNSGVIAKVAYNTSHVWLQRCKFGCVLDDINAWGLNPPVWGKYRHCKTRIMKQTHLHRIVNIWDGLRLCSRLRISIPA
jgi:hypothetical protein